MLLWLGIALALTVLSGCLAGIRAARGYVLEWRWNRVMETVAVRDWACPLCRNWGERRDESCRVCRTDLPRGCP